MRIVVSHVYSRRNNGDIAILACQLRELRRVFGEVGVEVHTLERVNDGEQFDGVSLRRSLMGTVVGGGAPRALRPLLGLAMAGSTLSWALAYKSTGIALPFPRIWREPLEAMRACDMQVCVGGGYLRAKKSLHSTYLLSLLLHQILLARLLGKPTYLYAQSFGPFPGVGQEALFRSVIRLASLILPRESISFDFAMRAAEGHAPVHCVTDSAFLMDSDKSSSLERWYPNGVPPVVVGITARQWLDAAGQQRYEDGLRVLIQHILDRGWGVMLIPQVTAAALHDDDRIVGRRLAPTFAHQPGFVAIEDELELDEIFALYSAIDYLVGTRFHSVIFALCSGVPCVAIEYEHKTSGILRDFGLADWCVPIEQVSGDVLTALFDRLVEQRAEVLVQIDAAVSRARIKARGAANAIAAHFALQQADATQTPARPEPAARH